MTNIDAKILLEKKLDKFADDRDLEELARILEYMPLAIVQAAAYIRQRRARYSVRQYIEAFQKNEKQKTSLLNHEAGHLRRDLEAKNSVIITWQISFDDIRERWPASADLLSLMSYFDPQGIPDEVLKVQLQDEVRNPSKQQEADDVRDNEDENVDIEADSTSEISHHDVFEECVERLQSYSLMSIGEDGRTFKMHALVQLATRQWLKIHREDEKWKSQFIRKLNMVFPTGEYVNWGLCKILFPHAKLAERQRPKEDRSVRDWAQILLKAGWYSNAKGDYIEAERMCELSARVLRKLLGDDDIETSYSLGQLATIYWSQGRWTEAEKMDVQVIETSRRVLGDEHPYTLTSMANLASTYRNQGRWTEAEKIEVQVIETSRRVLGDEHPSTLVSMANLASTYRNQGRWTEAEKIEVQVIEMSRRVLGDGHPDKLTNMNNHAFTMEEQGRKREAMKLMNECVQLRNRILGTEHPHTLSSATALARWSYID